jgi:hypothetical protein
MIVCSFKEDYQKVIEQHASEGWRLVQIFAHRSLNMEWQHFMSLSLKSEST